MGEGLAALGVQVAAGPDGLRVQGGAVGGGQVDSRGDHRIAMTFAVLGARAQAPIVIDDVRNVATSFPGFTTLARTAGLRFEEGA
jgi:5-enolpyruvylshikimate-3-phosphate synthase